MDPNKNLTPWEQEELARWGRKKTQESRSVKTIEEPLVNSNYSGIKHLFIIWLPVMLFIAFFSAYYLFEISALEKSLAEVKKEIVPFESTSENASLEEIQANLDKYHRLDRELSIRKLDLIKNIADLKFFGRLFLLACYLSVIPAVIGFKKRYGPFTWWLFGVIFFPAALICSIIIKPSEESRLEYGSFQKCPVCAELIKKEALVCRFCGKEIQKT